MEMFASRILDDPFSIVLYICSVILAAAFVILNFRKYSGGKATLTLGDAVHTEIINSLSVRYVKWAIALCWVAINLLLVYRAMGFGK